jgi:hypothetical protein
VDVFDRLVGMRNEKGGLPSSRSGGEPADICSGIAVVEALRDPRSTGNSRLMDRGEEEDGEGDRRAVLHPFRAIPRANSGAIRP